MMIKRKLSAVLLVAFLLSMVFPVSSFAAVKSFTDVTDSHWAKQQITRMNLRGIIKGYEDGTAKPNQSVTELEAVIMAIRMMGIDNKTASVTAGDYLPVTVPSWSGARESAVVAYQAGLIDSNDFKHDQAASREWIAKLLVKILGQESATNSVAGEYLSFTDTSKIGAEYLNYVKVAYKLGLIGGYTDGTFKPQNKVTRAEMAAFLSRCENQMSVTAGNVTLGTISKIDGINLDITDISGNKVSVYVLPARSIMYDLNGKKVTVDGLAVGDSVYAIHDGSPLDYLEIREANSFNNATKPNEAKVITIEGSITKILTDKKAIVITEEDNTLSTVLVDNDTKITQSNVAGNTLKFDSLRINDKVKVAAKNQIATEIIIDSQSDEYTQGGTIYDVDVYTRVIIMQESEGLKTYKMAPDMEVSIAGMLSATASNLKAGDKASYEIRNNIMVAIAVGGASNAYDGTGTIMDISTAGRFITYKTSGGELKADYYNNNTVVTFDGERGSIADLQKEDVAVITVNNNIISSIEVDSRGLTEGYKGTVSAVDTSARTLIIRDSDGNLKAYDVANNVIISIEEDSYANLSAIKKDMVVEYTLNSAGKVDSVRTNNRISGTVTRVNTNNYTIEVLPEDARNTVLYTVSNNVYVNVKDRSGSRLNLVDEGDEVEIKIVNDRVTQIDVATREDCSVYSTYSNSSTRVLIEDANGYKRDIYIYSDVDFIIPGNNRPRVRDLSVGDDLILTYMGNKLIRVEVTSQIAGTIEGLNPTSKVVTVRGYDGKQYKFNFDATSYVNKDGMTYNEFSRLAIGDKIAVTDSADDGRCFATLQSRTAKVGTFYSDKSRIFLQNSLVEGDWTSYTLNSNAYIHKGSNSLSPSAFPKDTNVTIYYVDKMVYEVVKL